MGEGELTEGFCGVAEGVAQIQQIPSAPVEFVGYHDVPLVANTGGDDLLPVKAQSGADQLHKQGLVKEDGGFDDLGAAVPEDIHGEGGEAVGVAQDQTGLPEGTRQIFTCGQVDGGLAADAGIHRRQKGGGHLDEPHAPLVAGGGKARQIANHAAAQGHEDIGPGQMVFSQKVQQFQNGFPILAGFPGGEYEDTGLKSRQMEAGIRRRSVEGPDIAVADDADLLRSAQGGELHAQLRQQAGADLYSVALRCADFDGRHPSTVSFRLLPSSRRVMRVSESDSATAVR